MLDLLSRNRFVHIAHFGKGCWLRSAFCAPHPYALPCHHHLKAALLKCVVAIFPMKCWTWYLLICNDRFLFAETLTMETTSTTSLDTDLQRSTNHRRTWRLRPSVRRQERLELDVPSTSNAMNSETSPSRDHGLRTPPGPPLTLSSTSQQQRASSSSATGLRRPTTLSNDDFSANSFVLENSQRYATHMMASDMSGLLAPPSRSGALARAHTDPTSSATNYDQPPLLQQRTTPNSPPPTYEEVMKQVLVFDDTSSTATASSEAFKSESCCSWWTNTAIKQQPQLQARDCSVVS